MADPTEADEILATALIADAVAHEAGRYDDIALQYDDVEADLLPMQNLKERRFAIALNFWDGWTDARNHDWYNYPGIGRDDWPALAREVAEALRRGEAPSNPMLLQHFAPENIKTVGDWFRGWLARLRRRTA